MAVLDVLFGRPLASKEAGGEQIGPLQGIPIFGLDALGSAAYGPEAALTLLIPLGAAGIGYIVPISTSIIVLLSIVFFSYRQTIAAYPGGGGSYTVARENLGELTGLFAASALMIDYVLTAAVGISAGVGAFVSAVPSMNGHRLMLCLVILAIVTVVNLRGVREAGFAFLVPTYLFVGCMLLALVIGLVKSLASGGHPAPVTAPPHPAVATGAVGMWLLVQAFSSGCTAMTGVEAVSNGVKAFRDPRVENAQKTLTVIIALLIVMLAGIAYLVRAYGIGATDPANSDYQSVLSMLLGAVAGRGIFYYVSIGSILAVLALSANTAFADFPRLCRTIAADGYLPHSFASTGRRLVYSEGIWVLAVLTSGLLVLFQGVTDRLIPLFAVGAFLAFTFSQAGMVVHWWRQRGGWHNLAINGFGALATGITAVVVMVAKFVQGAWVTLLLIPLLLAVMGWVKLHYRRVEAETAAGEELDFGHLQPPVVVMPIQGWSRISRKALIFSFTLSSDVRAVHVSSEGETDSDFCRRWPEYVHEPAKRAGLPPPELIVIPSPYRWLLRPIVEYVFQVEREHPDRKIAVVIPELVERRWYHYFLHNQRAEVLKALLVVRGNERIVVVSVPWYLKA